MRQAAALGLLALLTGCTVWIVQTGSPGAVACVAACRQAPPASAPASGPLERLRERLP